MYLINDKRQAIKNVQIMLNEIIGDEYIAPNGVFDDRLREKIIDFQEKNGLIGSGVVDFLTHRAISSQYRIKIFERDVPPIDFPIKYGDSSSMMRNINGMICSLMDHYQRHHTVRVHSSYFNESTEAAVNELRGIYKLKSSDFLDKELFIRMKMDLDSIEYLKENRLYE